MSSIKAEVAPSQTGGGDINLDRTVDVRDIVLLASKWSREDYAADLNVDGTVNIVDLSRLISNWGPVRPPGNLTAQTVSPTSDWIRSEAVGQGNQGQFFINATSVDGETRPYLAARVDQPGSMVNVPSASNAAVSGVATTGWAVGAAKVGGTATAWYRAPNGDIGLLNSLGMQSEARSVSARGVIAGFLQDGGTTRAVVWATAGAAPRGLSAPTGQASVATAVNDSGLVSGEVGTNAALWGSDGQLLRQWPGTSVDLNDEGHVLILQPTNPQGERLPAVATLDGEPKRLQKLPWNHDAPVAVGIEAGGFVVGSVGAAPAIWAPDFTPTLLPLPAGSTSGGVNGYDPVAGYAYGWVADGSSRRAYGWPGITPQVLTKPPTPPRWTVTPPPADISPKPPTSTTPPPRRARLHLAAVKRKSRLMLDVNPNLGARSYVFRFQRQQATGWANKGKPKRTQGPRELARWDVPPGKWRVCVATQHGVLASCSQPIKIRR